MRRSSFIEPFLALGLGILLAVVLTWPLAGSLGTALPFAEGFILPAGSDTHIWVWDFWWVKEALFEGASPFHCDAIFPPRGAGLGMHTHAILYGLLGIPLTAVLGAPFAVGAAILGLFAAAFAAMWLLARMLGASLPAAALAGFGWAFSPYFLQKGLEHMNLMASPWPPLLCLFLVRWMQSGQIRPALGAGLVVGLTAVSGPLILLQSLFFGLFIVLFAPGEGAKRKRLLKPWPLVSGGVILVLVAWPAFLAMHSEFLAAESYGSRFGELGLGGTAEGGVFQMLAREVLVRPELADFLRFSSLHPLSSGAFEAVPGGNEIAALHLSGVLLVLACAALFLGGKRRLLPWAGLSLLCFFLTWDPSLPNGLGLPSELYRRLPLMDGLRVPARFWPYALLPLALLAANGVDALRSKLQGKLGTWVLALLTTILVFESWPSSYPLMDMTPPPAVTALAAERPPRGADFVLTLPAQFGASEAMSWQAESGRGAVTSYLARLDPWVVRRLEQATPDLYKLLVPSYQTDGSIKVPSAEALALDLAHLGVGVVLVDKSAFIKEAQTLMEILFELLDDMPGWARRGQLGQHARWYRI